MLNKEQVAEKFRTSPGFKSVYNYLNTIYSTEEERYEIISKSPTT